jgi:predicted acyltransferase
MLANDRLKSLDAFRGFTVAAMILVNNPGSWSHVYPPLLHARWHGCTPTDLVFPFFLFSVGTSIHVAYQSKKASGLTKTLWFKILKRTLIIFALGLFLSLFPSFHFETVRIPGVLQRISLVFLFCSLLYFYLSWRQQVLVFVAILLSYFVLMSLVPVPGIGPANLEMNTNLAAWLDNKLLRGHLWIQTKTWDPEGVLSTLPAIATGISGMLMGRLLTSDAAMASKLYRLITIGVLLILLGLAWSITFPFNKALWTSSYVLYTSGLAIVMMSLFHWVIDYKRIYKWSKPLLWYGVNALTVFVTSGLLVKILLRTKITMPDETKVSVWNYLFNTLFTPWLSPINASLAFALMWVVFFGIILSLLYRRNIIIKI